jgi:hypothetical protein
MTLRNFIRDNRSTIDAQINSVRFRHDGRGGRGVIPEPAPRYNDTERREWVLNDEPLYRFAQAEGVRI